MKENSNGTDTNVGSMENSIEKNIKIVENLLSNAHVDYEEYKEYVIGDISFNAIKNILSDYKRVLKENEELKDTNCLVKRYFKLKDTNTYLQKENEELKAEIEYWKECVKGEAGVRQQMQEDYQKQIQELLESEE